MSTTLTAFPRYVNGVEISPEGMSRLKPGKDRLGRPEPHMSLQVLQGISLMNPVTQEVVMSESLWENQTCLFYLIRASNCPMCQYISQEYSKYLDKLRQINVRVIVVWHCEEKAVEFLNNFFPGGEIFIDKECRLYRALTGGKPFFQGIGNRIFRSDWKRGTLAFGLKNTEKFSLSKFLYSQFQAEAGGMYIIGPKDTGPIFSYLSGNVGDYADIELAYRVCQNFANQQDHQNNLNIRREPSLVKKSSASSVNSSLTKRTTLQVRPSVSSAHGTA